MMRRLMLPGGIALSLLAFAGCSNTGPAAPSEAGVCWHLIQLNNGKYRFNRLAEHQPNLENCAARLEDMRLRFNRLGKNDQLLVGAYQGQYIFIQPEGIFTAANLTTTRYLALVRTGDGRLAIPGAIQQVPTPAPSSGR
jgi:hypothetical protein